MRNGAPGKPRKTRFRSRECLLTPVDQEAFCAMLRDRYPTTIICDVDADAQRIIYFQSTLEVGSSCLIFIPEPGWEPEFHYREEVPRGMSLANAPPLSLHFSQALPRPYPVSDISDHDLPNRPMASTITSFAGHGEIHGGYDDDEPENKAFLSWVMNATGREWTNRAQVIDLETGKVIDTIDRCWEWAGPDALRQCEEDPDFFLRAYSSPSFEYDTLIGIKALPRKPRARKSRKSR